MSIKTKIEWCDMTVNPMIGCKHGCAYCYARKLNDTRFRWLDDFSNPKETKTWRKALHIRDPKNIFVGSMCDLWGDWVSSDFIAEVLDECDANPQHRYLFLTKNPKRYHELKVKENSSRENIWFGQSVTNGHVCGLGFGRNEFISIEPLLGDIEIHPLVLFQWIIIGAETGDREDKVTPKKEWIEQILEHADRWTTPIPVFMKDSLIPIVGEENMRREFPW